MYKNLLLCILSLSAVTLNAQTSQVTVKIKHAGLQKRSPLLRSILAAQSPSYKTTASHQRLQARSMYVTDLTSLNLADSNFYWYSNARGSKFNFNDMYFNDNGDEMLLLHDSTINLTDNGSGVELSSATSVTYTSSNKPTVSTTHRNIGGSLQPQSRSTYTYDGAGNLSSTAFLQWSVSKNAWDTLSKEVHAYNSGNKKTSTISSFNMGSGLINSSKMDITYDGSGNVQQVVYSNWQATTWVPSSRETFTYYPSNKLQKMLSEEYDSGNWIGEEIDSFGYNSTDFYTYNLTKVWNADSSRWDDESKEIRHLNSSSLPDTIYYYEADSLGNLEQNYKTIWSYNSNNDPIQTLALAEVFGIPLTVMMMNFYYETYWDLAVKNAANASNYRVYPNPVNDLLNIDLGKQQDGVITAQIVNVTGQVIIKTDFINPSRIQLPMTSLRAGNYVLLLTDQNGNKLYSQTLNKQ